MRGVFLGETVDLGVIATDNGKDVFSVVAFFNRDSDWNNLANRYYRCKNLYIEKYGEPQYCIENNPASDRGNVSQMLELNDGNVVWGAEFSAKGGTIQISIEKASAMEGFVVIRYRDEQNVTEKKLQDLDDI